MSEGRPDTARVLRGLRDFQRSTVEHVFRRFYDDQEPADRFLVADEVGLGKTLVAKGLIAKTVDHLWDRVGRIDVLYICSNAAIARQNVARLNITSSNDVVLPSRITLLPTRVRDLKRNRINFVSFTPGTSFDLQSSLGTAEERALILELLPQHWKSNIASAEVLMSGWASEKGFSYQKQQMGRRQIDEEIRTRFHDQLRTRALGESRSLEERFLALALRVVGRKTLMDDERRERDLVIGELRATLAACCLEALEPDLIILDEFQRFKHLLQEGDESVALAKHLFSWRPKEGTPPKILLLSATPYKMYTLHQDAEGDDHFADFIQTMSFLLGESEAAKFSVELKNYRAELSRYGRGDMDTLITSRDTIERTLQRVVVRTERLAATADRNGMVREVTHPTRALSTSDIHQYLALQSVSRAAGAGETIEFWKSSPYLLNFMENYDLKRRLEAGLVGISPDLFAALDASQPWLLDRLAVQQNQPIDPGNDRLRTLLEDVEEHGAFDVAWVPPSLPYYQCSGMFAGRAQELTKRLIFSSWHVVPKAVASLLNHEAERRLAASGSLTAQERSKHRGNLRFSVRDGQPSAMTTLGLIYPSFTLASDFDPLTVSLELSGPGQIPSLAAVRTRMTELLRQRLSSLDTAADAGRDDRWYWAAPAMLDVEADRKATQDWLNQVTLGTKWRPPVREAHADEQDGHDTGDAWAAHVRALRNLVEKNDLGAQPPDLPEVIAWVAIAGLGVASLRALSRVTGLSRSKSIQLRNSAGQLADAWLSFFNLWETEAVVHALNAEEPYWRRVLEYGAAGCIQAVLDEYAHLSVDGLGLRNRTKAEIASGVTEEIAAALRMRAATIGTDFIEVDRVERKARLIPDRGAFRARFAARFGARSTEEGASAERDVVVRRAFNSPFWPFVLCSTSVGQEGLDFHQYCHAVVHWNVPSNPVDFEQREGRVHRYKNHAVRKNVAADHRDALRIDGLHDPWSQVFTAAEQARTETSDLIPYWIYPRAGGAFIERHLPSLPLSTDEARAARVKRSLVVYRLAFGQSRQEDLLGYLLATLNEEQIKDALENLRIDLTPPQFIIHSEPHLETDWDRDDLLDVVTGDRIDTISALIDTFIQTLGQTRPELTTGSVAALLDAVATAEGRTLKEES